MILTLLFCALTFAAAWIAPKAFSWLLLGPMLGIPLGLTAWTIAIQFIDALFCPKGAAAFALAGALIVGFMFARGK